MAQLAEGTEPANKYSWRLISVGHPSPKQLRYIYIYILYYSFLLGTRSGEFSMINCQVKISIDANLLSIDFKCSPFNLKKSGLVRVSLHLNLLSVDFPV